MDLNLDTSDVSDESMEPLTITFPVVGIGASAGGLVALQKFFENLPANLGMAYVVVLHLSPKHESNADKILQRSTQMTVVQVNESMAIEANHVYVISPQKSLVMQDGRLEVGPSQRLSGAHTAIDLFMRTLADAHRERSIGIVLSGTGSDGSVGISRLKERGGVTFAQLPSESEYEDMPRNAIATGNVDVVLPVEEMPQKLLEIWQNARTIALPEAGCADPPIQVLIDDRADSELALGDIIGMLAQRTGHDFTHYKRATVLRRIERRLQVCMLKDLIAYRDYLRKHPAETRALLDDMLISVTNFFRDREAFEALERDIIPSLVAEHVRGEFLRCWVPGCATGEEAYSLAMLLREEISRAEEQPQLQIFASDIDEKAVAIGRRGSYPGSIITDVTPARLREHFDQDDNRYRIKKSLRDRILFAPHNVLRDPPFSRLDMISCRNLLIYLNRNVQLQLLQTFHSVLKPGGILFLGSSETPDAASELFQVVDKRHRIFRATVAVSTRRSSHLTPVQVRTWPQTNLHLPRQEPLTAAELHLRAMDRHTMPSVIVDADGNILHMSETAGEFLRYPAGVPSRNLLTLADPLLKLARRQAMLQAVSENKSVEARRVRIERKEGSIYVNTIVRPFRDTDDSPQYLLVLFQSFEETLGAEFAISENSPDKSALLLFEHELQRTREQLQATIELSDTSSEELKASNEELQAINEELRSASEELETSKEELQSLNEELITVNAELTAKFEETEKINDDLKNLIASTEIATIFVDSALNIKRYTPLAEGLFNLITLDIGRRLLDITHRLDYPQLAADASQVLETLQAVEREVRGMDGHWYIARIRPYQTSHRHVDGAVLTFVDVTSLRLAENLAISAEDAMRVSLQQSIDFALITLDGSGRISGWNSGAEAVFGFTASEMIGEPIDKIFTPEDLETRMPERERTTARDTGRAEDNRWHLRKSGERVFCTGVMTPFDVNGENGFIKIVRNVTTQQQNFQHSESQLAVARSDRDNAEASAALRDEFLAVMSHELRHPLNLINVNAEIIARTPDLDLQRSPTAVRSLATITRAVRTQSRIIDDLLDLSRIRTGKLALEIAPMDLISMVRSTVETADADRAASDLAIRMHSDLESLTVLADPARISQIIWNLLSNSIKFTPLGGTIDIHVSEEGNFARLEVIDTGQGIDAVFLPRIFEMFGQARARARSIKSGLGIGLALVKQLAEQHGGRIEGHSDGLGKGARFSVWLPRLISRVERAAMDPTEQLSVSCKNLQIVIVDDDENTVNSLRELLQMEGAEVRTATSADEAWALINAKRPEILLSDIGMPHKDGYELLARIKRSALRDLPVIALTGFGRTHDVRRAHEAGFSAHIAKPVSISELLARIHDLVKRTS